MPQQFRVTYAEQMLNDSPFFSSIHIVAVLYKAPNFNGVSINPRLEV